MTLGHSLSYYSPSSSLFSSSSSSSSSTSSSPVARGSMRKNRKFRSTKGASKARRDLINAEIQKLRALLPISAEERERLSYLHAMSVICTFIRKSVLLARDGVCVGGGGDESVTPACEDVLNTLPGFLVAMTSEGKLLYVSENVSHYLGLSMVDLLQGDTFYSMISNNDTEKVKFYLQDKKINKERSCVCVFRTNRQCCPLLVRLRVFDPQRHLVVALCSPSLRERDSFTTSHTLDMRYTHKSVLLHLGYEAEEMIGQSWYSIIHPDDLLQSARGHKQLMHCEQVDLVLRVQDKQLNWVWIYIIATRHTQSHMITCTNYIISEVVAEDLRHKLSAVSSISSPASLSPPVSQNSRRSTKRPAECSAESERRKNRRVSTAASSSLPYSPNSSFTSPAQEVGNIDFLFSSSAFCPFYLSPTQNFQWPSFNSTPLTPPPFCYPTEVIVPDDHTELPGNLSDSFLYLEDFNLFPASVTGSGRTFHAPEEYGWSGLLTPPNPALHYSEVEQAEISVLAQQISSLASSFDSYCTKSSAHRSDHDPGSQSCDPEAFLLDEEVIESVMQVPRAMLEVQALESLLDIERCSAEQQQEFSLYSHTQQGGFSAESLY